MPVGQAVIATSVFGLSAACFGGRRWRRAAAAFGRVDHPVDQGDHLVGRRRVAQRLRRSPCAPAHGRGWTAASCARPRRNPGRRSGTRGRPGRRVRRSRPPGCSRANPIEALSTYGERQCGIAMPPGRPVADWSSRAMAAAISPSGSVERPASASLPTSRPMTASLSAPASTSSRTRSVSMMVGSGRHGDTFGWLLRIGGVVRAEVRRNRASPARHRGRSGRGRAAPSPGARRRRCRRRPPSAAAAAARRRRRRRGHTRPALESPAPTVLRG